MSGRCYLLSSHQWRCLLGFHLQRETICHTFCTWNKRICLTHILSYSSQGILCQKKSSTSGECCPLMPFLSTLRNVFLQKYTPTRKDRKTTEISLTQLHTISEQIFHLWIIHTRSFSTCVLGCSDWLVKVTSRFLSVNSLLNTRSSTGFNLSKGECGRSKANVSVPLSFSSAKCTDGENKTRCQTKTNNTQAKMIASREHCYLLLVAKPPNYFSGVCSLL